MNPKARTFLLPFQALRKDYFFLIVFAVFIALTSAAPEQPAGYHALVDWRRIATLTGLMILTKGEMD
ncbi:MAG: anion transporter [Herminiimonas sp.]|nr:anion transporter [Herminiimonas sp.]